MLFDTHAHLNDPAFDADREEILKNLPNEGIGYVMNAGCSLASSRDIIAMAERYPYLYASVGSHPDSCDEVNEEVLSKYPYQPRNLRHYNNDLTSIRPKGDAKYYFVGLEDKND